MPSSLMIRIISIPPVKCVDCPKFLVCNWNFAIQFQEVFLQVEFLDEFQYMEIFEMIAQLENRTQSGEIQTGMRWCLNKNSTHV